MAFIASLSSTTIRQRLLVNLTLHLDESCNKAWSLKIAEIFGHYVIILQSILFVLNVLRINLKMFQALSLKK